MRSPQNTKMCIYIHIYIYVVPSFKTSIMREIDNQIIISHDGKYIHKDMYWGYVLGVKSKGIWSRGMRGQYYG